MSTPERLTNRDKVWDAALELALRENDSAGDYFTLDEVLDVADLDDAQRRTARRVLHAMNELGWLAPFEKGARAVRRWSAGQRLSFAHLDAGSSVQSSEPDYDSAAVTDRSVREHLEEVLPGSGNRLEARIDTVMEMYEYLREQGRAETSELRELLNVGPTGYQSIDTFWRNVIQEHESLESLPGVEPPSGGFSRWRYHSD